MTILTVRGKVNFRNLSRYSARSETTYARQFAKPFAFVDFNRQLINATFGLDSERVLAFDPSFIPKAGHHTFGRNRFWNGLKSRAEKGLEVSALAVVDLTRKQALNLSVQQTLSAEDRPTDAPSIGRICGASMKSVKTTASTCIRRASIMSASNARSGSWP